MDRDPTNPPGARTAARGFSLVEVLVTLSILAVALGALVKLQVELQRSGALARERAVASALAAAQLEQMLTDARRDGRGWTVPPSQSVQYGDTRYRITVTVDGAARPAAAGITVSWTDRAGTRHATRLHSLIAVGGSAVPAAGAR